MSDDARRRILDRRARFVAAAMTLGATTGIAACDGPEVCLEPVIDCDADTRGLEIDAPSSVCEGQSFVLVAYDAGACGNRPLRTDPVFATSDPELLIIDGATARALKPGTVTVTALADGQEAKATIVIGACSDAATDAADTD